MPGIKDRLRLPIHPVLRHPVNMSDLISESHHELIVGYALKTLTPEEMRSAEQLLAENPAWQQELAEYHAVMGLLAETSSVKAPEGLRSRILTAIDGPRQPASAPSARVRSLRRRRWSQGVWVAAAAVLLALGLDNYRLRQHMGQIQAQLDQISTKLREHEEKPNYYAFQLKGKAENAEAMGLVAVDLDESELQVSLSNLPPIEPDEAYHLWAFTKDGKILCGRFSPTERGSINEKISVRAEDYPSGILYMRVSREPAVTPPDLLRRILVLTSEG
jgi:Anti-sigma-K factor rskA